MFGKDFYMILFIIPFLLGFGTVAKLKDEYRRIGICLVLGYIYEFAIWEILYLVAVKFGVRLLPLMIVYYIVCTGLALFFAIKNYKTLNDIKKPEFNIVYCIFYALVLLQIAMRFMHGVTDGDDAYYLADVNLILTSGNLYGVHPYTGLPFGNGIDYRHILSGMPAFEAMIAKTFNIHSMVASHIVLADIFIILHYCIMINVGRIILKDKPNYIPLFGCMTVIFNVYGGTTLYTNATFFLTRTWQGKSILANIVIPALFLTELMLFEAALKDKHKIYIYIAMAAVLIAGASCSTMSVAFLPIFVGLSSIVMFFGQKKRLEPVWSIIACLPSLAIGLIYLCF